MYRNQSTASVSGCPHYSVFPSFSSSPSFSPASSAAAAGCLRKEKSQISTKQMCRRQSLNARHLLSFCFPIFCRNFIVRLGLLLFFLWLGLCYLFCLLRLRRCLMTCEIKESRSIHTFELENGIDPTCSTSVSLFSLRFISHNWFYQEGVFIVIMKRGFLFISLCRGQEAIYQN